MRYKTGVTTWFIRTPGTFKSKDIIQGFQVLINYRINKKCPGQEGQAGILSPPLFSLKHRNYYLKYAFLFNLK